MNCTPKLLARFWSKVKQTDNCWEWIGGKTKGGYGEFSCNGKNMLTHRFAYELLVGEIPKGLQIDHLCRNRACANPEHMEVVTPQVNSQRGDHKINNYNSQKTHCPKGHDYLGKDNTGKRFCKICSEEHTVKWKINNREHYLLLRKKSYQKRKNLNVNS